LFSDPVYFSKVDTLGPSEAFAISYKVALVANFITGLLSAFLGMFGPLLLQVIPPAALLVPIAGIGIAFLGLEQITASIAAPIVGFSTIMWVFLGWYGGVRLGFGGFRLPEALQVILVGVILGWATGLNTPEMVTDATTQVKWWGPDWSADELFQDFGLVQDYLGIVIPIALAATASTLMCLVSAREAGDPYPVRETMISDGIGTMIASFFGSPFGTVIYIGHPAHKRSGARTGYSLVNGMIYIVLSWFGLLALMQSIVNTATVGPIVLFVGLMINEEALNFMPHRHYPAYVIGIFPSIYDWVVNVANLSPLLDFATGGNKNLGTTPGWFGVLGWKRGALLVSFVWVAMLVMVIDRRWKKATLWALVAATFSLFGIIHVPEAGFNSFTEPVWEQCVSSDSCWEHGKQWQFFVSYMMLAGTFAIIEAVRTFVPGSSLLPPIEDKSTESFLDWFAEAGIIRGAEPEFTAGSVEVIMGVEVIMEDDPDPSKTPTMPTEKGEEEEHAA
jgi:adenine/guanine/hypoxanthine permease